MPTIPGTILATISDEELSALVATECAGWTKHRNTNNKCSAEIPPGEALQWEYHFVPPQFNEDAAYWRPLPSFATDANAIVPLLEKWNYADIIRDSDFKDGPWSVALYQLPLEGGMFVGHGPTFARAAAFALLKAKGWTVKEA